MNKTVTVWNVSDIDGGVSIWNTKTEIDLALIIWWEDLFEKHANVWENRKKLDNLIQEVNNNDWNSIKITLIKPSKTFNKIINLIDNFIDEIISFYTNKRLSNVLLSGESFTFIY